MELVLKRRTIREYLKDSLELIEVEAEAKHIEKWLISENVNYKIHNGVDDEKIYVESEFGVGSEFSFTLEKSK